MAKSVRPSTKKSPSAKALQTAVEELNAGNLSQAEFAVRLALTARPDDGDALNLLGGIALRKGNLTEALSALERAAAAKPRDAGVHFNLAGIYRRRGELEKAVEHYDIASRARRGYADAETLKGEALKELGEWQRAIGAYQTALQYSAKNAVALNGLGQCLMRAGDHEGAVKAFTASLEALPPQDTLNRARVLANVGRALLRTGAGLDGLRVLADAAALAPDNGELLLLLARSLRHVRVIPEGDGFRQVLLRLFEHEEVDPRDLASAAAAALKADPAFVKSLRVLSSGSTPIEAQQLLEVTRNSLLLAHLRNAPVTDGQLELALTNLRRQLTLEAVKSNSVDLEFVSALARQAFLNEYVWGVTAEEETALTELIADLSAEGRWSRLALAACYTPWSEHHFEARGAPAAVAELIRQQIGEPAEERALAAEVPALSSVTDSTSLRVRAQYEQNPYPRWVRVGPRAPRPFRRALLDRLPHLAEHFLPPTDTPRVLIAGCGTGLETMNVINAFEVASVLAIDLSRASLGYACRKLKEQGVTNVDHRQADILALGHLEDRFDLIHSFGVIHHMANPQRGLAILSRLLKPGGILFLGLYSKIARRPLVKARTLIAERQIKATKDGIRHIRREILTGGVEDPELAILASPASDFWTLSECRDLMFHVEEHQFTLLEVEAMFAREGLAFLGLEVPHAPDFTRFRLQFPEASDLMALKAWHAFEEQNPEVFGGTYRLWARSCPENSRS
ncbi:MAG: tetratricopeptide repeat protein [Hyphomicrobium sp.]|uniref:class I SAM-dependent methyltransferase n=1 Tax=Hyphomicrobium sp. TaxID=82 RepID=UPI0025BA5B5E|nr:class I SAM-dependent methyltransferase [Hyphomicrobium sp.]MBZ0209255.1 tetratricopeptide repeat protein [Hyphomicrobium sp.]